MSQSKLFAAILLLAGMAISCAAEAQTTAAKSAGGTGQSAAHRRLLGPRPPVASHRSPTHHRRGHGTVTHGTPVHRTMAGPRV